MVVCYPLKLLRKKLFSVAECRAGGVQADRIWGFPSKNGFLGQYIKFPHQCRTVEHNLDQNRNRSSNRDARRSGGLWVSYSGILIGWLTSDHSFDDASVRLGQNMELTLCRTLGLFFHSRRAT